MLVFTTQGKLDPSPGNSTELTRDLIQVRLE